MKQRPERFIFMKVGKHAGEDFDSILARKRKEFEIEGKAFWGYGGPTCHPLTQVRPFVKEAYQQSGKVYLLMETIDSKAHPDLIPATEYSEDGIVWKPIPKGVTVTGSRYAVILGEIKPEDLELPLDEFTVALGRSEGRVASDYIQGRVDKACLAASTRREAAKRPRVAKIQYSAELLDPFGVILR